MKKNHRSYAEMQQEEAKWESGRYALTSGSTAEANEEPMSLFNSFKAIATSLGLDNGILPASPTQFAIGRDGQER